MIFPPETPPGIDFPINQAANRPIQSAIKPILNHIETIFDTVVNHVLKPKYAAKKRAKNEQELS